MYIFVCVCVKVVAGVTCGKYRREYYRTGQYRRDNTEGGSRAAVAARCRV